MLFGTMRRRHRGRSRFQQRSGNAAAAIEARAADRPLFVGARSRAMLLGAMPFGKIREKRIRG
jgi:hypothetical protein